MTQTVLPFWLIIWKELDIWPTFIVSTTLATSGGRSCIWKREVIRPYCIWELDIRPLLLRVSLSSEMSVAPSSKVNLPSRMSVAMESRRAKARWMDSSETTGFFRI